MKKKLLILALAATMPLLASSWHALAPITATTTAAPLTAASGAASYTTGVWVSVEADPANASGTCAGAYILIEDKGGNVGAKLSPGQSYTAVASDGTIALNSIYIAASATSACIADVTYVQN